jgi:endogenous inhibitor of DNA gyrase (YacG/DUF329 family)
MAGVYRQKQCPTCGITHRRRGPYCSRSCAAKDRTHSAETIEKIRESNKARVADVTSDAYLESADNLRAAAKASKGIITDPVPPRMRIDRSGETIDGDYWVSADDW